jgi:hypothetical protein
MEKEPVGALEQVAQRPLEEVVLQDQSPLVPLVV